MAYMIGGLIIYLILVLFFWSLCAINNRHSFKESENQLGSLEVKDSFGDILVKMLLFLGR